RASDRGPHAGRWDNTPVLVRILALRQELAAMLGYESYAHLSLVPRMASSPGEVLGFLRELGERALPVARREFGELQDFARARFGAEKVDAWDVAFYSEKLRQERYEFSEEELRPYFPAPRVLEGMFSVAARLYGVRIEPADGVETWHPDVRFFSVRDEHGALRGWFYVDLYARRNKRGGAWMDDCI